MKIIFFDTETNGLPKNYKADYKKVDNWPRVIQLAWALVDVKNMEVIHIRKFLIKPDGWEIPKEKFWIDNGFSTEKSLEHGHGLPEALSFFLTDVESAQYVAAHNLAFDRPIVFAEMERYKMGPVQGKRKPICTMTATTNLCQIPHANGKGFKWPKLEELHQFLFKTNFEGAHDAGSDVSAGVRCLLELIRREVIILD